MRDASSRWLLSSVAIAATALATTPAAAQETGLRRTRDFINAAAQSDEFERMEATTALAQSKDPDIHNFATEMLTVHRETSQALMDAVARAGLRPPQPGMNGEQSAFLAALQSARGKEFDQLYVKQQTLAHRAALATDQGYAANGDVPAVKQVATSTVDVITEHLRMADELAMKLRGD